MKHTRGLNITTSETNLDPAADPIQDAIDAWIIRCAEVLGRPISHLPAEAPTDPSRIQTKILAGRHCVGHLEVIPTDENDLASLKPLVQLLADMLGRIILEEDELQHRISELGAVYRVSAALAGLQDLSDILECALRSVIQVMNVKAGSIRMFDEESDELTLRAAVNLSDQYFDKGKIFAHDSTLDLRALDGEVVYVEDLRIDPNVRYPDLVIAEELRSFLSTGMVFRGRPVGVMRLYTENIRRFSAFEHGLLRIAAQQVATAVINAQLFEDQRSARQVQRQVRLASSVQQRMLPQSVPNWPGLDVAAENIPSLDLGGDFYDFLTLGESLGICIGDVAGKGIPAALLMASVRASLRAHAHDLYELETIIQRTNIGLHRDTRDHEFATMWYGVIDSRNFRLTYCNAGHEPVWLFRRSGETWTLRELDHGGMVMGVEPKQRFDKGLADLLPGDVLLAYSDGLTEAQNFDREMFGKERLRRSMIQVLETHPDASAKTVLDQILWDMRRFTGLNIRSDDVTIVVVRVTEDAKRPLPSGVSAR